MNENKVSLDSNDIVSLKKQIWELDLKLSGTLRALSLHLRDIRIDIGNIKQFIEDSKLNCESQSRLHESFVKKFFTKLKWFFGFK